MAGALPAARCELRTFFTRSSYCVSEDMSRSTVAEISDHRIGEDVEFARQIGVKHSYSSLDDAILRKGYGKLESVLVTRDRALEDPILADVVSIVAEIKERLSPRQVVAPLAMGGHVDHWLVRLAAECVFESDGVLSYYEDLPYAGYVDMTTLDNELTVICNNLQAQLVPDTGWLARKLALLEIYASQITTRELAAVRRHTERIGGERLFRRC